MSPPEAIRREYFPPSFFITRIVFPKLLTLLYTLFAAGVAFSYIPQVLATWRDSGRAEAISLPAWSFWTINSAVATLYAMLVARDLHIAFASACAFLGCGATTFIVIRKRFRGAGPSLMSYLRGRDSRV